MPYRAYIFDLDGTLFRGDEPLPHAVQVVSELRRQGARVGYVTNNSSRRHETLAEKLSRMGFEAAPSEVFTSADATASYCLAEGLRTVYVVGEDGLTSTLADAGLRIVEPPASGQAEAVIAGISRSFSYAVCSEAMQHILGGSRFIATNADPTYPLENDKLVPGAGAIVAAIQACTGVTPFVVGKPNAYLIEMILRDMGVQPSETLVVGDRVETDIESARRAGCNAHLVLTGVTRSAPDGVSSSRDLRALLEG